MPISLVASFGPPRHMLYSHLVCILVNYVATKETETETANRVRKSVNGQR